MYKKQIRGLLSSAIILSLSACAIGNQDVQPGQNADSTLGNINVRDGIHAGHLDTVNGNVDIGKDVEVKNVDVVNGNITIGDNSRAHSLETVNGNIEAGNKVAISQQVETVNGDIRFGTHAHIGGSIETVNGDIVLQDNAQVLGNIIFAHPGNWGSYFGDAGDRPSLEVGENFVLEGDIILYRPIDLKLPAGFDSAKVINRYQKKK